MAKSVSKIILGIDVAKDQLVICNWRTEEIFTLTNQSREIRAWLKTLYGPVQIALEPTATYHMELVDISLRLGHEIYLINPRQLAHYREAVNVRNKADPQDACLLARYLVHEGGALRPYRPQCLQARQLWTLIKRRGVIVHTRQQLRQSLADVQLSAQTLYTQFHRLLERIDLKIIRLIRSLGWHSDYLRCKSIKGIGQVNAAALVAAWHRGAFANSDAFIAYMGLDVRLRESGNYRGKRKLTKRGEAELRRLLYCAAQPARHYWRFDEYYQKQLNKGLSKTASKIILARKLARIAFALMINQEVFVEQPQPS